MAPATKVRSDMCSACAERGVPGALCPKHAATDELIHAAEVASKAFDVWQAADGWDNPEWNGVFTSMGKLDAVLKTLGCAKLVVVELWSETLRG